MPDKRFTDRPWPEVWRIHEITGIVILNSIDLTMATSMHYCEVCRFELREQGYRRHAVSVFHKKAKLIRAMLERNCITHAEIARRIGLSRERVRQLALRMGFSDGKSRHAICRIERRRKAMPEFFVKAKERGFAVEPLGRKSAYINGMICVQRQACWRAVGQRGYEYKYLSIRRPSIRFDICAWRLPDGPFLILPKKLVGFRQTVFTPKESDHPGTAITSHHYREYIERWSLLEQARDAE